MGSKKQPLKEEAIRDETCTEFIAHTRCSETVGRHLDEVTAPCDIAARRSKSAAGILDERPRHNVHIRDCRRLLHLHKLAVAVIHKDNTIGIRRLDARADGTDICNAERLTLTVAARTLDECHLRLGRHDTCDTVQIHVPLMHGQFIVGDTELLQRSAAFMCPPDHRLHRIVGCARDGDEAVAGTENPEQYRRESVRPRDELRPHESTLRTKDTRIELIQFLAPEIAVRIARAHVEMRIGDTAFPHRIEHLLRVLFRDCIHALKRIARACQYIRSQTAQFISLHNVLPFPSSAIFLLLTRPLFRCKMQIAHEIQLQPLLQFLQIGRIEVIAHIGHPSHVILTEELIAIAVIIDADVIPLGKVHIVDDEE